jgi:hypothetical protein
MAETLPTVDVPHDDWPFLYLREKGVSRFYGILIAAIGGLAIFGVLTVSGDTFDDIQVVNFHNPWSNRKTPATKALDDAIALDGIDLRVVSVTDLVLLKLYAGGLKSLADIVGLLEANADIDLNALNATCREAGLDSEFARVMAELAGN